MLGCWKYSGYIFHMVAVMRSGITHAAGVMTDGKLTLVDGYGDVGEDCAFTLRGVGARALIADIDLICALQACMEGLRVVRVDGVAGAIDVFTSTTGNLDIITSEHKKKTKYNVSVANVDHLGNEI